MRTKFPFKELPKLEGEVWLPVPRYKNYMVSNLGRIVSVPREYYPFYSILQHGINHKGYAVINLYKNGKVKHWRIHRLVLLAFKGPRPKSWFEARHLNGVHADNRISNLQWSTRSENHKDIFKHKPYLRRQISMSLKEYYRRKQCAST